MKKVIFTSLVGDYDILEEPLYIMPEWDFICFSNNTIKTVEDSVWQIRQIPSTIKDNRRLSRYAKLLPHKVLAEYDISVYIDANIIIKTDKLEKRIQELVEEGTKIAIAKHPDRNCIYDEAEMCKGKALEGKNKIDEQMIFLKNERFPKQMGLYENNIIYRQHNEQSIVNLDESWWSIYNEYSQRDQLSLVYLLWKLEIYCEQLFENGFNVRDSKDFIYKFHRISFLDDIKRKFKVILNKF
ncbi:glycosyltransferase domain-containing protein [Leeuwenhoekiella polynyae]|uniref:TOD1/MUCI70 glycosyltransferase-like domain-containing protein n=1 Tax=Leeuwenhoekiella polynyae TaxID=1550906 RepID=A0A4Q0NUP0_9FLAO|nr:glycosyltransferase domain-containing protein [Leeuwenhoekiella polynyae]RXG14688.1 putative protein DUF616 [Leeuwenhoekiella polynyae]